MKDKCVLCGVETRYDEDDHVDMRYGYIEGVGQLCINCSTENDKVITIPVKLVLQTPNDMELGEKVRTIYYENK